VKRLQIFIGVEVSGAEQGGLVGGQGFQVDSGIKLANVWSIDYDLWRMYGFKLITWNHISSIYE